MMKMKICLQCMPAMWKSYWTTGDEQEKNKKEAIEHLTFLESEIKEKKLFGGDTIGLVDIVANFIVWSKIIADLVEFEFVTEDKFPNLIKWVDEYSNSSIVKENQPSKEKLAEVFHGSYSSLYQEVIGMAEVKLFGFWASPFSRRVEMALKLKGVEYEYIEEDLSNKSELLLKYNPVHKKVPVLLHNGKPIVESLIIIEYIDQTWEGPSILPKDPYERAMARFWAKLLDEKVRILTRFTFSCFFVDMVVQEKFKLFKYVLFVMGKRKPNCVQCLPAMWKACWSTGEERDKNKEEAIQHLTFLESEIKGKKFFVGDTIGLVDIAANFIAYWFGIITELKGVELITQDKFPNLSKWGDDYTNSSFVKENLPPKDKLVAFFKAHIQAPDETKYFPKF
ncbi:hypothetical protein BUALT_BualtUnG0026500 [Buddleja alternifolia]|uniref:Probable glutathione S-transferase n=1 Tax=Buddleja alternifolia TaxID=168488 RepID=A0AAV6W580_9LAMI|nr:hypothetical protein BUALT_BualtUnG0026500 [Buddleja alternifolia]